MSEESRQNELAIPQHDRNESLHHTNQAWSIQ
jgi:hypothetical protein